MSVIIFGNGPLPIEPEFPVTAPGSRTWQIIKTAAMALADSKIKGEEIKVYGLDEQQRPQGHGSPIASTVKANDAVIPFTYVPLKYEAFKALSTITLSDISTDDVRAVIGTASAQPYSTAAKFAEHHTLPVWIDVFGDPICETQSQAELLDSTSPDVATKMVHVWKLLTDGLLHGDRFSTLSKRQRYALLGQLGCAGRLNQHTAPIDLVASIPYALFLDDFKPQAPLPSKDDNFTVMWCGSFNTWMDVPTLTRGLVDALRSTPNMRLMVVGGRIAGYNETSYDEFLQGIRRAGVEGAVTLMDWQPLSAMQSLYSRCDIGISIDRFTYEAELGSRTRLVNFLAAGVPIASTVVTELSQQLLHAGQLVPFELGDSESLTDALISAASDRGSRVDKAKSAIRYAYKTFNGIELGRPLSEWIKSPCLSPDKGTEDTTNGLLKHTRAVRESLGV